MILPYLLRSPAAYCFSPRDAERARAARRRQERQSPLTPSQRARKAKQGGRRRPGERYTTPSYRRAITRAVEIANRARKVEELEPLPNWAPNQLRHLRAGEIEEALGIEAASAVLGHADLRTTQVYARRKLQIATTVARQIG